MFDHYLITRFNLKNPKWELTKNNETLLNDEWMQDRMNLFENFCLPSVVSQKNKNFTWLLYFDSTTKEEYKTRINALTANYINIKIFFIDGIDLFINCVKETIREETKNPYLITSRIDNDDSIHIDFIDEIQKQFRSQDYMAVDVISGYTLQIEPIFMLGKKEHIFNPFISLIEKNSYPKTVWSNDHNLWKKENRIIQIKGKRLWMSVIHQKNKVNEFDGYGNINWSEISSYFKVAEKINVKLNSQLLPFRKWWFLSFRNKLYVKSVLLSKILKKTIGIYNIK